MAKSSNEITVVVSSRKTGEECEDFIKSIKDTCGCHVKVIFVTNQNSMGLSELYGGMLANQNIEGDYVVLMHDDIELLRSGWGSEVIRLFKKYKDYGIIGVAGSAQYDPKVYGWWNHPKRYGQVLHKSDGKSWLTCFSDIIENDIEEVCVIDGVFMAVNRRKITKNFDKDFRWHGYDIDFCLANYLDGRCKIGVTTNIRLAHKSVGGTNEEWTDSMARIAQKYEGELPIDMPKPKDKRFKK